MKDDKVLYTDGRDVTVTDAALKVKNTSYSLNGIMKLSLWTIRPDRWPGILLVLLGLAAGTCGYLNVFPATMTVDDGPGAMEANTLALWVGAILFLIGVIILALAKERYAVRIKTAEGEKNAVVSRKREYIKQIVDAVNTAFDLGPSTSSMMSTKE